MHRTVDTPSECSAPAAAKPSPAGPRSEPCAFQQINERRAASENPEALRIIRSL